MQKAIADAYARGFLGKNIRQRLRFRRLLHGGAGAYEVGEESALMESLEQRGIPRIRPPSLLSLALGRPTVIIMLTLASVPHILWAARLYAPWSPKNAAQDVLPERTPQRPAYTSCHGIH